MLKVSVYPRLQEVRCRQVVILRRNPDSVVVPFDTRAYQVRVDPADSILSLAERLAQFGGGGTDCSIPLHEAATTHARRAFAGIVLAGRESHCRPGCRHPSSLKGLYKSPAALMLLWREGGFVWTEGCTPRSVSGRCFGSSAVLGVLGGMQSDVAYTGHVGEFFAGLCRVKPFMLGRKTVARESHERLGEKWSCRGPVMGETCQPRTALLVRQSKIRPLHINPRTKGY